MNGAPALVWFRRDLRLGAHPALTAAVAEGGPVIPVFILDPETEALGAAPKWRLGLGIAALARALAARGSRLVLRRGPALDVLGALAAGTGARAVHWSRLHDPASVARDSAVKAALRARGIAAHSHPGHLLFEPHAVTTGAGGPYRVFTPFWRAVAGREVAAPLPAPSQLVSPPVWPASDVLADWHLDRAMDRGAAVVRPHLAVGEDAALDRLAAFLGGPVASYAADRDRPDRPGTSRLSENLAWGEIAPATVWHAAARALAEGAAGAETFRKELVWREFAWHLLWHTPHIATRNWRPEWDAFPWRRDAETELRWRQGMTGEAMVDAGLRELRVTGTMHNRVRMLAASWLTKHLLIDWRAGLEIFADMLVDWDPASNALGWQWVAGSGPDAAPYFRIFNPRLQAQTHDPDGAYRHRFVAGLGEGPPHPDARSYFDAVPRAWNLSPSAPRPPPLIEPGPGRARALAAWASFTATKPPESGARSATLQY